MAYFKSFGSLKYMFDGEEVIITDITRRSIVDASKTSEQVLIDYKIQDGETLEQIADRVYDRPEYAFVIMMINQIHNVYNDVPLGYNELISFVNKKYADIYAVHHYENNLGDYVDSSYNAHDRLIITKFDYEEMLNESKRDIKILHPDYVGEFVSQHKNSIGG